MIQGGHMFPGAHVLKEYQIGEAITRGAPLVAAVLADVDGVKMCTTSNSFMSIGLAIDGAPTRNTAQQTNNSDPAVYVSIDARPDLLMRSVLSGGSTDGTALEEVSNLTASTNGLLITTTANQSAYDDGVAWGATGANAGKLRKITAVTTTSTPIIAYPSDIAVGDTFYFCTFGKGERAGVTLTTALTQVDASSDGQANSNFRCWEFYQKAKGEQGATRSEVLLTFLHHIFGVAVSAS